MAENSSFKLKSKPKHWQNSTRLQNTHPNLLIMAVACFKTLCLLYWGIVVFAFSLYSAISHVQGRYTVSAFDTEVETFLLVGTITLISTALIGCICVKCDITNPWGILFYVVPTILLCTIFFGLMLHRLDSKASGGKALLETLADFPRNYPHISNIQIRMEKNLGCCGIFGYKDYRAFITPAHDICDLPSRCLNANGFAAGVASPSVAIRGRCVKGVFANKTIGGTPTPLPVPDDSRDPEAMQRFTTLLDKLYGTGGHPGVMSRRQIMRLRSQKSQGGCFEKLKNATGTNETACGDSDNLDVSWRQPNATDLIPGEHFAGLINTEGCGIHMKKIKDQVAQAYILMGGLSIFASVLMSFCVIFNCVEAKRELQSLQDGGYQD